MNDIKSQVRSYIYEAFLFGAGNGVEDDASLLARGVLDSTGVLELILFLEQQFGIQVEDAEMLPENLDSIVSIERFVQRKREARQAGTGGA